MQKIRLTGFAVVLCLAAWTGCAAPNQDAEAGVQSAALASATKDWSMALYDAVGSGHNSTEKKLGPDTVGDLEVKWRFDASVAGHDVGPIHATPVVRSNRIFVGSNLGRFYAIDEDGSLAWEYLPRQPNPLLGAIVVPSPIGSPVEAVATPVVGAAVVTESLPYVIFGDLDGNLYALHRSTGEEIWMTAADPHPLGGVVGNSLLLVGDTLIVGFASIENLGLILADNPYIQYPCCSHRGSVAAFDVATGAEKWRTYAVDPAAPLPAAFDPYTLGPSGGDIWGQPTYDEDTNTIYVGTGQNFSPTAAGGGTGMSDAVIALDFDTGAIKWVYQATTDDIWNVGVPSPDAGGTYYDQDFGDSPKIYEIDGLGKVIGLGQKSGEYHVVDAATGAMISRTAHVAMANPLGGLQNLGAMADGRIFQHGLARLGPAGSQLFNGVVLALSPDGVTELWRYGGSNFAPGPEFFSPLAGGLAVANDVVYVVSPGAIPGLGLPEASELLALDATSGTVLKSVTLEGRALSSPVVSRGRIYLGEGNTAVAELGVDESGGLVALGLPDDD